MGASYLAARATGVAIALLLFPAAPLAAGADTMPPTELAYDMAVCARHVAPETQAALVYHESGADEYAIHDNNPSPGWPRGRSYAPRTEEEALTIAQRLVARDRAIAGRGIDLGLGQINSHNLAQHHVTVAMMFDPCVNLALSAAMLRDAYDQRGSVDEALQIYNSGSPHGDDGYVALVRAAANEPYVRAIAGGTIVSTPGAGMPPSRRSRANPPRRASAPRTALFASEETIYGNR